MRWELDLQELSGARRRLRPGGGPILGGAQPRMWLLVDASPESQRLGRALADAVGWPCEEHRVEEGPLHGALRGLLGHALAGALLGHTARR